MSIVLPVDTPREARKQPWLLHILMVNTMNFCSFAQCVPVPPSEGAAIDSELLLAVPNTKSSETVTSRLPPVLQTHLMYQKVDIFHLPSCDRIHTVPGDPKIKGGMIMAISIFPHRETGRLTVIAGYESGHTVLSQLTSQTWQVLYTSQPHSQPILSLDVAPSKEYYVTSSADAIVAKHPIPLTSEGTFTGIETMPLKTVQTKHSGQQGLRMRDDGKIFATAGWDSRVRVYDAQGIKELAVLKWHKEGCYAVSFADVVRTETEEKNMDGALVERVGKMTVKEERLRMAKMAHWLAVGSKDGKVSLWDIY
jgi:ASTRA-associated protein 1